MGLEQRVEEAEDLADSAVIFSLDTNLNGWVPTFLIVYTMSVWIGRMQWEAGCALDLDRRITCF